VGPFEQVLPALDDRGVRFVVIGVSGANYYATNYDVTPAGRFIMLRRGPNGGKLRAVVHWTEEVKQILAAGGVR
jgi:hypothetical protein